MTLMLFFLSGCLSENHDESVKPSGDSSLLLLPDDPGDTEPVQFSGVLQAHNNSRKLVRVKQIVWSTKLAVYAQEWANNLQRLNCETDHRPDDRYGENIVLLQKQQATPQDVVAHWEAERNNFDMITKQCVPGKACSHYAQIISPITKAIGCGVGRCTNRMVWVCNYDPW
ncbi:hypothetical protein CCP2SC5_380009 [Azospirillaceae bacterium]